MHSSPNIARVIESRTISWADHVVRMEECRPRRRREDNIRMDLKEMDINTRNWFDLIQDRDYC